MCFIIVMFWHDVTDRNGGFEAILPEGSRALLKLFFTKRRIVSLSETPNISSHEATLVSTHLNTRALCQKRIKEQTSDVRYFPLACLFFSVKELFYYLSLNFKNQLFQWDGITVSSQPLIYHSNSSTTQPALCAPKKARIEFCFGGRQVLE